jgi:hypothetical protein
VSRRHSPGSGALREGSPPTSAVDARSRQLVVDVGASLAVGALRVRRIGTRSVAASWVARIGADPVLLDQARARPIPRRPYGHDAERTGVESDADLGYARGGEVPAQLPVRWRELRQIGVDPDGRLQAKVEGDEALGGVIGRAVYGIDPTRPCTVGSAATAASPGLVSVWIARVELAGVPPPPHPAAATTVAAARIAPTSP